MSENKFTPWPWFIAQGDEWTSDIYTEGKEGKWNVASVNTLRPEQEYNKYLIAAAPELLEALEELVSATTSVRGIDEDMEKVYCTKSFMKARQVISKAKGESCE